MKVTTCIRHTFKGASDVRVEKESNYDNDFDEKGQPTKATSKGSSVYSIICDGETLYIWNDDRIIDLITLLRAALDKKGVSP